MNYYRMERQKVIDFLGGKCVCCGETEPTFLAIDHVEDNGKEHREKIGRNICRWLIKNNFERSEEFQLLCHNCNHAKRLGDCPHLTK